MTDNTTTIPQAVVMADLAEGGGLNARAGASEFAVGGPDGRGGKFVGANPYDLLSASLAACTTLSVRLQAQRRKFPLSNIEVAVSYRHGADGARDVFDREITLHGPLAAEQRALLMEAANYCPVGKTLGSARTSTLASEGYQRHPPLRRQTITTT